MRRTLLLLGVVGIGAAGVFWLRSRTPAAPAAPVETHVVTLGDVAVALKETGVVVPRQTVAVKSKVSGRVLAVLVAEGDVVRAGQLLAVVEPDSAATLTLSQRRLELRRRKIEVDQKEKEWRRQQQLAAEGLAATQWAETTERDFRTSQIDFLQEKTALNILEREANQPRTGDGSAGGAADGLTEYRIVAPISGVVSSVKVKPGELATSGTTGFSQEGALLLELADQRQLEVVVNVNEIDVPKVHPGMPAKVTLSARPGAPIPAAVARVAIAPVTDENKLVVYPVHLALPERPPELRQGMSATVDLTLATARAVLRVPVLAIGEKDGKSFVRVNEGGTYVDRAVEIGLRSDRFAEVKAGLREKDVVAARFPSGKDGSAPK